VFTGIVEELGTVRSLETSGESARIKITARKVLTGSRLGDSVAVNGVCLTVSAFAGNSFTADIMPETLRKTNLLHLKAGDQVNLERALALGGRLGGHLVSGHIDGVGKVREKYNESNAIIFHFSAPAEVIRLIVPRGSVAVDGISLTVAAVERETFSVSVIPHTATETTLGYRKTGDPVNLENDLIGKYVDRLLGAYQDTRPKDITVDFLKANGFIQ
jgi:riboflavin synthase